MEIKRQNPTYLPLWKKYKPRTLEEVRGRDEIIERINALMNAGEPPNMLFEGTQGSGKTLIMELLINKYFGGRKEAGTYLIVDASKSNKVDDVREKIVTFMKGGNLLIGKRKVLGLDEVDFFTPEAQAVLRRPLETAIENCLTFMTCNFVNKLMLPIQSRFTMLYFPPIPFEAVDMVIKRVIAGEQIKVEGDYNSLAKQVFLNGRGEIRFMLNNFMEHARASKVFDQKLIDFVVRETTHFATLIFSGQFDKALEEGLKEPKGALSGMVSYIMNSKTLKMSDESKQKMISWVLDSIRDISAYNMPPYIVIQNICLKLKTTIAAKKKELPSQTKINK